MHASARSGRRCAKKSQGQAAFSASWSRKRSGPKRARPSRQAIHPATAMTGYSKVQTGPNTQPGGVQGGFRSAGYHSASAGSGGPAPEHGHPEAKHDEGGEAEDVAGARDRHRRLRTSRAARRAATSPSPRRLRAAFHSTMSARRL